MKSELALIQLVWKDIKLDHQLQNNENTGQLEDCLDQVKLQIDRCGQITQSILKFARQSEPMLQPVDLMSFVPDVVKMMSKQAQVNNIKVPQEY